MQFHRVILIPLFIIFILSDDLNGQQQLHSDNEHRINLKINDTASYTNNNIFIRSFTVSPIEKVKVWVFTEMNSFELNLQDSSWTDLAYLFGNYSRFLRKENIYRDNQISDLLWIYNKILICFDLNSLKYREYPEIRDVTSMCFLKEFVMVGTWKGVYRYTRADGRINRIEEIPLVNINSIEKIEDKIFLINNKYEFNDQTKTLQVKYLDDLNISQIKIIDNVEITSFIDYTFTLRLEDSLKKFNYWLTRFENIIADKDNIWIFPDDLKNGVLHYSTRDHLLRSYPVGYTCRSMKTCDDEAGVWIYNNLSLLYFDKKDHSTRFIKTEPGASFWNLAISKDIILANTGHQIKLYSKKYLLANSVSLDQIIFETERFKKDADLFHRNQDYFERFQILKDILATYANTADPEIRHQIRDMKAYFSIYTPNNPEELQNIIDNKLAIIDDEEIQAALYLKLVNLFIWQGELDSALKTDSLLNTDYPAFRDEYYRMKIEKVVETNLNIRNIWSGPDKEDEKLWKTGNEYYNLFIYAGRETEGGTDMTYPFRYYQNLVDKYPESQYADNASFLMLRYEEELSHEGGGNTYNLEAIGQYQSILGNYPGTEYTPEIYFIIGDLYSWYDADYKEMKGYLEQALVYLQKIKDEYPGYDKMDNVNLLIERINNINPWYEWELLIKSNKTEYAPEEPVVLNFRLTNNAGISQEVKFYISILIPNFQLEISRYPDGPQTSTARRVPFEEDIRDYDETKEVIIIKPGELYEESWDIKKNAWQQYSNAPGYFNLKEGGSYKINAFMIDHEYNMIPSNAIWIEIK